MISTLKKYRFYFYLLLILLFAYLPLSTLHFGMKNDAFSDNFPDKYFLSQTLHAGFFPLWNPYMNFGFPVYADPGFAFWNPVTWLFAITGYNAYILTIEVLLYVFISGITTFNLCRYLRLNKYNSLAAATMFMCSGFFIGSIQFINFITAAAFLSFMLQSFLQLIEKPSLKRSCKFSLSYYCVVMGGHPAIPIASTYFLIILFVCIYVYNFRNNQYQIKKILLFLSLSIILLLLLIAPMLYSYSSVWEFYGRNSTQQQFSITNIGFSLSSFISFLYPFTTTAHSNFFSNDVAMRNAYFSTIGFISLLFVLKYKIKLVNIFLITSAVMLLLTFGGSFKENLYSFLPGLNFVRTNGEYRVFVILLLCLVSGFGLEKISKNTSLFLVFKKYISAYIFFSVALLLVLSVLFRNDIYGFIKQMFSSGVNSAAIKFYFDNETLLTGFLISLCMSVFVLLPFIFQREFSSKNFIFFIVADLIINSIIYLPVTGVGTATVAQIQTVYDSNPQGIPVPKLIPINKIDTLDSRTTNLAGNISYYNKNIGTAKLTDYPSYFSSTDLFFKSVLKDTILSRPFIFLKSGNKNLSISKFSPQHITIHLKSLVPDSLVLLQNDYKFWNAYNNNSKVLISKTYTTFMAVAVNKGDNEIQFIYNDRSLFYFVFVSFAALIFVIIVLIANKNNYASTTSVLLT